MAVWMIGMQQRTVLDRRKYGKAVQEYNPNLTENYVQSELEHKGAQSATAAAHSPWLIDANFQPLDVFASKTRVT